MTKHLNNCLLANYKWQMERPWYSECTNVCVCVPNFTIATNPYNLLLCLKSSFFSKALLCFAFSGKHSLPFFLSSRVPAFFSPPTPFAFYMHNLPYNCVFPSHNHKNTNNIEGKGNTFCCCLVTRLYPSFLQPHGLCSLPDSSVYGISQLRILE